MSWVQGKGASDEKSTDAAQQLKKSNLKKKKKAI